MPDAQAAEGTLGGTAQPKTLKPQIAAKYVRLAQTKGEAHILQQIAAKIHLALQGSGHRIGSEFRLPLQDALLQSAGCPERQRTRDQIGWQAVKRIARRHLAGDCIFTAAVGEAEDRETRARALHKEAPCPIRPRSLPVDDCAIILVRAKQAGQNAASRRSVVEVQVEAILVGHGVDQREQPVASAQSAAHLGVDPARANIRFGGEVDRATFPAENLRRDRQVGDAKTVYEYVEIG